MKSPNKPQLVVDDFNFSYLDSSSFLEAQNFSQLITEPTHIEGNILDQAYFKDIDGLMQCTTEVQSKYYTDHKGLAITVKQGILICTI